MSREQVLHVLINEELMGQLKKHANNKLSFCYEKTWLQQPVASPISLSMPLTEQTYEGDVVYHFFDNLLPDNPLVRQQIQRLLTIETDHPFDLLAAIGHDCIGAIQLCKKVISGNKEIRAEALSEKSVAELLRSTKKFPLGMMTAYEDFRISIAGFQPKTALLRYQGQWQRPFGTTPTTHIFKLPIGEIEHQHIDLKESCENEWLCTQIAKGFGFSVAEASIETFEDVKALVVERFDRKWLESNKSIVRLPQEDFCQGMGYSPNKKYEMDGGPGIVKSIKFLLGSVNAIKDRETFFQAQILFYLLAAIDGHAKNFSIFIKPLGNYSMTPLYDILSVYPLIQKKQLQSQKIKMAMALIGKNKHYHWDKICYRHFISTAEAAGLAKQRAIKLLDDMLHRVDEVVSSVSKEIPKNFPVHIADPIFQGMLQAKKILL